MASFVPTRSFGVVGRTRGRARGREDARAGDVRDVRRVGRWRRVGDDRGGSVPVGVVRAGVRGERSVGGFVSRLLHVRDVGVRFARELLRRHLPTAGGRGAQRGVARHAVPQPHRLRLPRRRPATPHPPRRVRPPRPRRGRERRALRHRRRRAPPPPTPRRLPPALHLLRRPNLLGPHLRRPRGGASHPRQPRTPTRVQRPRRRGRRRRRPRQPPLPPRRVPPHRPPPPRRTRTPVGGPGHPRGRFISTQRRFIFRDASRARRGVSRRNRARILRVLRVLRGRLRLRLERPRRRCGASRRRRAGFLRRVSFRW